MTGTDCANLFQVLAETESGVLISMTNQGFHLHLSGKSGPRSCRPKPKMSTPPSWAWPRRVGSTRASTAARWVGVSRRWGDG